MRRQAPPGSNVENTGFEDLSEDAVELTTTVTDFAGPSGSQGMQALKVSGLALGAVAVFGGLIWGVANTEHVGPQDIGVVYNRVTGEVENLDERGSIYPLIDYNPFRERVESVPGTPQTIGNGRLHGVEIRTSDPLDTTADFVLRYRVEDAADLIRYHGSVEAADHAVYSAFREVARTESGSFSLTDLQGIRTARQEEGEAQQVRRRAVQSFLNGVNEKLEQQVEESWGSGLASRLSRPSGHGGPQRRGDSRTNEKEPPKLCWLRG